MGQVVRRLGAISRTLYPAPLAPSPSGVSPARLDSSALLPTWQSDEFDPIGTMRLTSLADYAVVMMAAAARHGDGARLSAACLAAETGVPLPTAQKLMGRLAVAGLLSSARGTGGGFRLAREAGGITLADIIEAVEGPIAMTTCVDDKRNDCALDGTCQVKPHLSIVNDAVRGALAQVSLIDLASPPPPVRPELTTRAGLPELVEGPSFSSGTPEKGAGFDMLSQAGAGIQPGIVTQADHS